MVSPTKRESSLAKNQFTVNFHWFEEHAPTPNLISYYDIRSFLLEDRSTRDNGVGIKKNHTAKDTVTENIQNFRKRAFGFAPSSDHRRIFDLAAIS